MTHSELSLAEQAMQTAMRIARTIFRDEHMIADVVSTAWEFAQAGRGTPTTIAYYAIRRVRSNRQFRQSVRSVDTQMDRKGKHQREGSFNLNDLARVGEDPALIVEVKIDYHDWLDTLPPKLRSAAELLAEGETTGEVARLLNVTPGRVSQYRVWLNQSYHGFVADRE